MTSRVFWTMTLTVLAIADLAARWLLGFNFVAVLKVESILFTATAVVLFLRMRREDAANAWPRWVRSLIVAALLLAVVRAGTHSLGLELYLANLTTLAIAIISAVAWRMRSWGRDEIRRSEQ